MIIGCSETAAWPNRLRHGMSYASSLDPAGGSMEPPQLPDAHQISVPLSQHRQHVIDYH